MIETHDARLFDPEPYTVKPAREWPCPQCGGMPVPEPGLEHLPELGADPCLGWLTDVAGACCGHGFNGELNLWERNVDSRRPYVVISPGCSPNTWVSDLPDRVCLLHNDALEYFRSRGVGPPATSSDREAGGKQLS